MASVTDIGLETAPRTSSRDLQRLRIVPARHPWRVAGTVLAAAIILISLHSVFTNERWGWSVFAEYFFSEPVLAGLGRTLQLTAVSAVIGFILGGLLAFARVSKSPLLSTLSWGYIWLLRSIPLIVLLLVLNNLGYLYATINLGVPFTEIMWAQFDTVQTLSPFAVAVIGLSLNQAAFSSEIIRGGILSVDQGQHEAAAALGLSRWRQAVHIVLPQAMRAILPSGFNEIIGLAKATSIVYVLALPELFYTVQVIYRRNLEVIPLLMVATVWYLIIMVVLSAFQYLIEQYYSRGARREALPPLVDKLFRIISRKAPEVASAAPVSVVADRKPLAGFESGRIGGEVAIHGVNKSFGTLKVLDDIDLTVGSGEVVAIIGPSGAGKSTLLRTINHLERVNTGLVAIDSELIGYERRGDALYELKEPAIRRRRAGVGMVFQNFNLFPHLTALENVVEAPISVAGVPREQALASGRDLLARVGLADKADVYPRHLSGGQQQRVAIARALALRPKVLLFDEPTSALDPELVGEVLDVIKELAKSGTTLVIVTHEIGFAREVADRIVFMEAGRILEIAAPERLFSAPTHHRTREFLAKVL
ncbi:amino acid ABC transporter permease/ATP-binding protein [Devosia rhizoryzae]|uniref:Amino acid ABC transporter permease/ATP-binding protein n=1 Tax=Devosia rhizoryzae TaxID=2774137 RepID=A0ABX7C2N4_9HYPH|nr:amino acid ABC transporter permease/ATP-binding protein [Devosia rhizoryzae]QQR38490.1 amino acid ABC transporter permease/ATP-binding protein [Devosia rhizoryzae]